MRKWTRMPLQKRVCGTISGFLESLGNTISLEESLKELNAAINMWTDNIFNLISYLSRQFSMDQSTIHKQFEIPEDIDYVV